ncbi:unnamed protein product, partial [Effrenium voratum]
MFRLAIAESLDDAQELQAMIASLDAGLGLLGKRRVGVPGDGDCQYWALSEAGRVHGLALGSNLELRALILQTLLQDQQHYEPFVEDDLTWAAFLQKVITPTKWGDNLTLQAFADGTGHGIRVYVVAPDPVAADYRVNSYEITPVTNENPALFLEICNMQDWHFDAVFPADWNAAPKKEPQGQKRKAGYDMSQRRPGPGALKHKYAVEEGEILEGVKAYFLETAQSSKAKGSPRVRVCGEPTAGMHWYGFRQYAGYLKKADLLPPSCVNGDGKILPARLLTSKNSLRAFYSHLEEDFTCRGTKYKPGAIQLSTRSLAVLMQVILPKYLGKGTTKTKKTKTKNMVNFVRALGKSSADKRAIEGDPLPKGKTVAGEPPLTAVQLVASYKAYLVKISALEKRVADLPADTPENQVTHMRHRLAKLRAYGLGWTFILQTTERVRTARTLAPWIDRSLAFSTLSLVRGGLICCVSLPNQSHGEVLNKTLCYDPAQSTYFFIPSGVSPTKTAKSRRLSRKFFVSRKYLSAKWSRDFDEFMKVDFQPLMTYLGQPPTGPRVSEDQDAEDIAPFAAIHKDVWRKGIAAVAHTPSTDIRMAVESHLLADPEITGRTHQVRSLQHFVGHDEKTSLKHYHGHDAKAITAKIQELTEELEKSKKL